MADNTTIALMTGGDVIATDDISGVKVQRVKVGHGADGSYTDASAAAPLPVVLSDGATAVNVLNGDTGQKAQLVAGAFKTVTFTTTTVQAVASSDVGNYRWASLHITSQGTGSTVTFQGSNDNTNWVTVALVAAPATGAAAVTSATTTGGWMGAVNFRYFRLNVTGISAGTTAGTLIFNATPGALAGFGVAVTNTPAVAVSSGSAIGSQKATVTTAGTRVQLGSNSALSVTVRAKLGNAGIIYVGGSAVAAANGFDLAPGEAVSFDVTNTNVVYIDAATSGDSVSYLWVTP